MYVNISIINFMKTKIFYSWMSPYLISECSANPKEHGRLNISVLFLIRTCHLPLAWWPLEWPFTVGSVLVLFWVVCAVLDHYSTVWPGMFASARNPFGDQSGFPCRVSCPLRNQWLLLVLPVYSSSTLLVKSGFKNYSSNASSFDLGADA